MNQAPIRVLVADDAPGYRAAFAKLLARTPGFAVAAEAADGTAAVRLAAAMRPDVVLMDVQMPGVDGLTAARQILAADPRVKVIVLTTFDLEEYVHQALTAGASGFLLKNAAPEEVLNAITAVHAGHAALAPEVTARLIAEFPGRRPPAGHPFASAVLSERELEVVRLVAQGLSNAAIAAKLHLSPETVKTYLSRTFAKLGVRDRTQLAVLAHEAGLLHGRR